MARTYYSIVGKSGNLNDTYCYGNLHVVVVYVRQHLICLVVRSALHQIIGQKYALMHMCQFVFPTFHVHVSSNNDTVIQ